MQGLDFQARNIQFIEFELNNQCQYSEAHTWCPRNKLGTMPYRSLDTSIIIKTIEFFKQYDFSGTIYFSIYNEPLLDNRLLDLIRYVKNEMPKCTVQMYTNGILLDQEKYKELCLAGLDICRISNYGNAPQIAGAVYSNRLQLADNDAGYDDRVNIYNRKLGCNSPCYMPIQYYMVTCNGDIMLCFDDWKCAETFGNLYTDSVEYTLMNQVRLEKINQLKQGNRQGACIGCNRPTWMCLQEYKDRLVL